MIDTRLCTWLSQIGDRKQASRRGVYCVVTVSAQFLLLFNEKGNIQKKTNKKQKTTLQYSEMLHMYFLLSREQNDIAYCTGKGLSFGSMKEQLTIISIVLESVEEKWQYFITKPF